MYLLSDLSVTNLYIKGLYYLGDALADEANVCTREKFLLCLTNLLFVSLLGMLENSIPHNLKSRQSAKMLTT